MSQVEARVQGDLDAIEEETLAVLDARREYIRDGELAGRPWLITLIAATADILRRRKVVEVRRQART